jgi:hypothetical protein
MYVWKDKATSNKFKILIYTLTVTCNYVILNVFSLESRQGDKSCPIAAVREIVCCRHFFFLKITCKSSLNYSALIF